ncbi:MAG: LolA family protein [Candidatus Latescibacterota bacterium]|jgi:outer membrane lipoprotein-sorting protein
MKYVWIVMVCLFFGVALADDKKVSTGDAKTDEALVAVQEKRGDVSVCQARLFTVYKVMDQEIEDVAEAFFQLPNLMFLGAVDDGKWTPSMISDSGMLWTYDAAEKIVTKFNRGRIYRETNLEVDAYIPDPLRPFRGVVWETIRLHPSSDKSRYVFEAQLMPNLLSAQLPVALVKTHLTISAKDGLLRTQKVFDTDGNEIVIRRFEDVRLNAKIPDKLFEFVIPSGAHVMDGTGDAVELLKSLSESH